MMKINKKDLIALPNLLGYFRIILIPLFVYFYLNATLNNQYYYYAAIVVIVSGITDFLDGYIARHYNMITEFGKVLDPVADKLTQMMLLFCISKRYPLMGYLVVFFLIKEGFMLFAGLFFLKKNMKIDGAKWFGKVSTAVLYLVTIILILFPQIDPTIAMVLIYISGGFLALSFIMYFVEYVKMWQSNNNK